MRHAPLAAAEVARLHEAALELLATRGAPLGGETTLALLAAAGASADPAAGRVRLPAELVRRALATAPASFVLPGRTADRDVTVGGGRGGLMAATAAAPDMAAAALLADALPEVAVVGVPTRRLAELPAALEATAKPVLVCGVLSAAQADVVIAVAAALGGRDGEPRAPLGVVVHSAEQTDLDPLLACVRAGLPCGFSRRRCSPASARPTAPQALVALHAAALAACAAAQLAAPGAPYLVPACRSPSRSTFRASAWARPASRPSPSSPSSRPTPACPSPPAFRRRGRRPTSGWPPPTAPPSPWRRRSAAPP